MPTTVAARTGEQFLQGLNAGEREIWLDYGCEGWPSLFLWGRGGALSWFHFGEGEYEATELAIQEELRAGDALRELPAPMEPRRATDAAGAAVLPPTPELFPAGEGEALDLGQGDGLEAGYEAGWELRVQPYRVYYDVDETARRVRIVGIARKPREAAMPLAME